MHLIISLCSNRFNSDCHWLFYFLTILVSTFQMLFSCSEILGFLFICNRTVTSKAPNLNMTAIYWHGGRHTREFSHAGRAVKAPLSIPALSAPAERIFSWQNILPRKGQTIDRQVWTTGVHQLQQTYLKCISMTVLNYNYLLRYLESEAIIIIFPLAINVPVPIGNNALIPCFLICHKCNRNCN